MAPLSLAICVLGAIGVDALGGRRLPPRWALALASVALLSGAALATLLAAPVLTADVAQRLLGDSGSFYRSTLGAGLPHLVVALAALLAAGRFLPDRLRGPALALLVGLTPAAAVYFGAHLGSRDARGTATPMRLETEAPAPRIVHPTEGVFLPAERRNHVDVTALHRARLLYPATNVPARVDTFDQYGAFPPTRLTTLFTTLGKGWGRSFRRFGATHVAVPTPNNLVYREATDLAIPGGQLVQREEALRFELWAVPHRPWAFFARRAGATLRPETAREAVVELIARQDDGSVVVEGSETPLAAPGRVLSRDRGVESLRIDAEALGPALLVVQDAWWPGWRATIDCQPTEILPADYLVRAVRWPAGRHRLEMVYDPAEVRTGLALSTLGCALVLLLAALTLRRARAFRGGR
jgi:hypothetical protein